MMGADMGNKDAAKTANGLWGAGFGLMLVMGLIMLWQEIRWVVGREECLAGCVNGSMRAAVQDKWLAVMCHSWCGSYENPLQLPQELLIALTCQWTAVQEQ
jgi:hypothetical protein